MIGKVTKVSLDTSMMSDTHSKDEAGQPGSREITDGISPPLKTRARRMYPLKPLYR